VIKQLSRLLGAHDIPTLKGSRNNKAGTLANSPLSCVARSLEIKSKRRNKMSDIYSVHAREAAEKHMKKIKQSLDLIGTEMQKYESLNNFHYGHVGDLAHVEELLGEVWEFISEAD